jgi:peptidoglycan LD-endopeptidase CwlK
MTFTLGNRSLKMLEGVHPDLVRVVRRAIQLTPVDFTVLEGMRTVDRQRALVKSGASQTMNSRHLTGHAVDLGAWVDGQVRWDWPLYYPIARAMQVAAQELGVPIRWGGHWGDLVAEGDPEEALERYAALRRSQGRRAFLDGPHYELPAARYPAG